MRINITYHKSLSFEQFKEQFEEHFLLSNPVKKEADMKKVWEKAEARLAPKVVTEPVKAVIAVGLPLDQSGNVVPETIVEDKPLRNKGK